MGRILVLVNALLLIVGNVRVQAQMFDQKIIATSKATTDKAVATALRDMAYWLERSTNTSFKIVGDGNLNSKGIHVRFVNETNLTNSQKEQLNKDGQTFYLAVDRVNAAQIVGTTSNSIVNGIYTFLHELGFRWYMPGDNWTIVPKNLPTQLRINKIYSPDFQGRFYAGTGGLNAIAGLDPKNTFKSDYNDWNRRNRFAYDYAIKGHMGQQFYNTNKKVLDAHPEWFCNGKVNRFGRIDISKPEVVNLFVEWALGQVKSGDRFPTIGVDPSDGAGGKDDCLPKEMPQVKNWSDKYFWLANQVSKALSPNDDRTQIHLYAYSNHAAPPSFALEKNVYPIIIPYAFQRLTSATEFIKLWSKKMEGRPMGMYDYWNITQWSSGLPQFNIYSIPQKLRLWKQHNITSINIESTNGKGAMGHALWLAGQMMWNTQISFDSLYNNFLQDCFGPAASDIKNMYDRWSLNFQDEMEVDLSLKDLERASLKTKNQDILNRLAELKAYVHFMKLFYEYKAKSNSLQAFNDLTDYIRSIHHLRLLQTSALLERYIKPPSGAKQNAVQRTAIRNIDLKNIETQFERNLQTNDKAYTLSSLKWDITRAQGIANTKKVVLKNINGRNTYQFFLSSPKKITIKAGATVSTRLTLTGEGKKIILERNIRTSKDKDEEISIQLAAGTYTLSFGDLARFSRLTLPGDVLFVASGTSYYDNAGFPNHFVYVPKDVDAIVYKDEKGPGVNKRGYWLSPDGARVNPELLKGNTYRVPVPAKYRGKVWTLNIGHRSFEMLNIPNRFAFSKFTYKED